MILPAAQSAAAQIHPGHDHESDHHAGGLHHLPTIGPLYPLKLGPAAPQERHQPRERPTPCGPERRRGRGGHFARLGACRTRRRAPEARPACWANRRLHRRWRTASSSPPPRSAVLKGRRSGPRARPRAGPRRARRPAWRDSAGRGAVALGPSAFAGARTDVWAVRSEVARTRGHRLRPSCVPRSFAVASHAEIPPNSARFAVSGVALAPAAVFAQLESLGVVPLALVRLVVPALALLAGEGGSDPDISAGHLALPDGWSVSAGDRRAC